MDFKISKNRIFQSSVCLFLIFKIGIAFGQNNPNKIIIKESFAGLDYKVNSKLNGLNGGIGWSGPWTGTGSKTIIEKSAIELNGAKIGVNKVTLSSQLNDQEIFRTTNTSIGTNGTTAWISFTLQRETGDAFLGLSCYEDAEEKLFIGSKKGTNKISIGSETSILTSSLSAHQLFVRIDFRENGDVAYLFVDPSSASDPDIEGANATIKGNFSFNRIRLAIGGETSSALTTGFFGPISIGNKFEDLITANVNTKDIPTELRANLKVLGWKKSKRGLLIKTSGGTLKLLPFINKTLKVQFGSVKNIETSKSFAVTRKAEHIFFDVKENKQDLILTTPDYSVRVLKATSQIKVYDKSGKILIQESSIGGKNAVKKNFVTVASIFQLNSDEALYGLGQFKDGVMNLRGKRRELVQMNTQAAVPVILSTNGWGMFWDNPSRTIFNDTEKGMMFSSDFGSEISYYIFIGSKLDDLVCQYRNLTGVAPLLPQWALGYHQSRNKYATQSEVIAVSERMRKEKIPFNSIFIDYYYWGKYGTGSHRFDEKLFPNFTEMVSDLHTKYNTKAVITVWPAFKPGTPNYEEMKQGGFLLDGVKALDAIVYDAFNPQAAALYWKQVAKYLVPTGIDGWFLDGPEPDNVPTFLQSNTFAGPAHNVRNLFPLVHSTTFYNGLLSVNSNKRPYILTRCAWASQQKNGTAIWSGDIGSSFDELKKQIPAGLNFVATGIPYWTTDIGGYSGGDPSDAKYQEIFTRWWQYGAFCPIFRSHGRRFPGDTKGLNELWAFGPEVQKICLNFDDFRYRLLPYIYSLSGDVTLKNYTPMRLLAFDFPKDTQVLDIKDQFMFGPALLINPVTEAEATKRTLYLPKGSNWINFWSGEMLKGGVTVNAEAPITQIPIFVKAGSIIPMSPSVQYADGKSADPIELRVYPGENGQFELYEDDGETFNYKKAQFSRILIKWNEVSQTLTIGKRMGNFKGMLEKRNFHIIWVRKENGTSIAEAKPDVIVNYSGDSHVVKYLKQ